METTDLRPLGTVPAFVAELAVAVGRADTAVLASCGRMLGERTELDLDTLATIDPAAAAWCAAYWARCTEFWEDTVDGRPNGAYVVIERRLRRAVQLDTTAARTDLRHELEALETIPALAGVTDAVLGTEIDTDRLAVALAAVTGSITTTGVESTVTTRVTGKVLWPAVLGGAASPAEAARRFTFEVSHAGWRDRKVRRLRAVEITVEEIWPDPAEVA